MALDNVTSHFSTMLEPITSASFLSSLSIIHGQTKKVISRGHSFFSLLASLLAHQSGKSFYIALEC